MDESKEYIAQCNCPEIQNRWVRDFGDYYCLKLNDEYSGVKPITTRLECEVKFGLNPLGFSAIIWLPKQDQLQKMWLKDNERKKFNESDFEILMHKYFLLTEYAEDSEYLQAKWVDSMEKMWLLIVMKELHNKKWNGEVWNA